ncbi:PREDICTED: uncharacterized protein LOC105562005 isoform X2 [Vollenhovia emeryi]|uniref:uncharacterized protein LOC105562005 isoform X2 n=1 Tax=Vollenhovia emeryi TaxID=411798 RepID=UPI0005F38B9C|nr:PREDICTED: uncharacterized protein LOC105562005 isoform X2 [Vollenhovia emeryi]
MLFNPYNVIMLLYATFTYLNFPQSPTTSEEVEVKEKIQRLLLEIQDENQFELEEEDILDFYNTYEAPEAESVNLFEADNSKIYLPEEIICSSVEATISDDYKRHAVEYWRSGITGPRSLEGVRRSFKIRQINIKSCKNLAERCLFSKCRTTIRTIIRFVEWTLSQHNFRNETRFCDRYYFPNYSGRYNGKNSAIF